MRSDQNSTEIGVLSVHETVYLYLRDMILHGDLAPGQALTIQGLNGFTVSVSLQKTERYKQPSSWFEPDSAKHHMLSNIQKILRII